MKTNSEMRNALHTVLTRIDADKKPTAAQWEEARAALASCEGYAKKCRDLYGKFEGSAEQSERSERRPARAERGAG